MSDYNKSELYAQFQHIEAAMRKQAARIELLEIQLADLQEQVSNTKQA